MRRIETLADVQIVLRGLLDFQSKIETSGLDLHGLQVRNAASASQDGDYVNYQQLQDTLGKISNINIDLQDLKGMSIVIHIAGGFTVAGQTYHDLVFRNGVLSQIN